MLHGVLLDTLYVQVMKRDGGGGVMMIREGVGGSKPTLSRLLFILINITDNIE